MLEIQICHTEANRTLIKEKSEAHIINFTPSVVTDFTRTGFNPYKKGRINTRRTGPFLNKIYTL